MGSVFHSLLWQESLLRLFLTYLSNTLISYIHTVCLGTYIHIEASYACNSPHIQCGPAIALHIQCTRTITQMLLLSTSRCTTVPIRTLRLSAVYLNHHRTIIIVAKLGWGEFLVSPRSLWVTFRRHDQVSRSRSRSRAIYFSNAS